MAFWKPQMQTGKKKASSMAAFAVTLWFAGSSFAILASF